MKRFLQRIYLFLLMFGMDPLRTLRSLRGVPAYVRDRRAFRRQMAASTAPVPLGHAHLCLDDRFMAGGSATGHYFHQDLLIARRIYANQPTHHVDIGSRVDGFVAHVASFREIEVFDIRPTTAVVTNIRFVALDLMEPVSEDMQGYCDSLSCLHALEHFGLGRYGDPVKVDGHLIGLANIHRLLKPDGRLYLSVPIGPLRVEFNAQRVFSIAYLLDCFDGRFRIDRFSFVDDQGDLHEDVTMSDAESRNNFGCTFGCGIFELIRLQALDQAQRT